MSENNPRGTPVLMPEELLIKLAVAQIKAELDGRDIYCPSKSLKKDLLAQLRACLHVPVVKAVVHGTNKKRIINKSTKWGKDHQLWKLLYDEIKSGNIPLDPNQMGASAVHERHCDTFEFQIEDMNFDVFIERLREVRDFVLNEEPILPWNDLHPAKILLCDELVAGRIPLTKTEMGPAEVYCQHADTFEFNLRGMEYSSKFEDRLERLRSTVQECKSRAADDKASLEKALKNHPVSPLDHRGYPQWNGSLAQALLKMDVSAGVHLKKKPSKLWSDSDIHRQGLPRDHMRWRMRQEARTRKYLHTLRCKAEIKLRDNLKDLPDDIKVKLNF